MQNLHDRPHQYLNDLIQAAADLPLETDEVQSPGAFAQRLTLAERFLPCLELLRAGRGICVAKAALFE
jgi:hypothetical protein